MTRSRTQITEQSRNSPGIVILDNKTVSGRILGKQVPFFNELDNIPFSKTLVY